MRTFFKIQNNQLLLISVTANIALFVVCMQMMHNEKQIYTSSLDRIKINLEKRATIQAEKERQMQIKLASVKEKSERQERQVEEREVKGEKVDPPKNDEPKPDAPNPLGVVEKPCLINNEERIGCLQVDNEVYMPFSFIQRTFEVLGEHSSDGSLFLYKHAKGRVHDEVPPYDPTGSHADDIMYFVEGRKLIKWTDGITGVVVTRQWFPEGFYFSTSIAQFGLSHYSKWAANPIQKNMSVIAKGQSTLEGISDAASGGNDLSFDTSKERMSFKTPADTANGIVLKFTPEQRKSIQNDALISFTMDASLKKDSTISFEVQREEDEAIYHIHYVTNETAYHCDKANECVIGIGDRSDHAHIARNVRVDLEKGALERDEIRDAVLYDIGTYPKGDIKSVTFKGEGEVYNLTMIHSTPVENFQASAEWLLANMDDKGGWPMPVKRILGTDTLQPGWYTALGQGVGMSILCRAYHLTKEEKFIDGCIKATNLFHVDSKEGGVRAIFEDKYVWYEEYPTQPPSFVLNGFITALLGLYDVAKIAPPPRNADAQKLFDDGMRSLKALLPLFDSGTRTLYDLRHMTMHTDPNICRWDYHNLHIELLMFIATIDNDPMFKIFIERWKKYRMGWRSRHN